MGFQDELDLFERITIKLNMLDVLRNSCRLFSYPPESIEIFHDSEFYCNKCQVKLFDFSHIKASKCIVNGPDDLQYYLLITHSPITKCGLSKRKNENRSVKYHSIKCKCKNIIGMAIVECMVPISSSCEKLLININSINYTNGNDTTHKDLCDTGAFLNQELSMYIETFKTSNHVSSLVSQYFTPIYKIFSDKINI